MEDIKTGDSHYNKDQIAIHTMPKRYLGSVRGSSAHAKSTGFLILAAGAVLLCVAFVFLYLYYSKSKEETVINQESAQDQTANNILPSETEDDARQDEYDLEVDNNLASDDGGTLEDYDDYGEFEDYPTKTDNEEIDLIATATSSEQATSTEAAAVSISDDEEITEAGSETSPKVYKTANDTDGDGLGDIEELLLDCNISAPDSDGDGYKDLDELLSLYNPAGGGKIIVNPNIAKYSNQTYKYSLYHPNIWILKTVGGDEALLFQISTDQFMQIAVEPNTGGQTIEEWYQEQFGIAYIPTDQRISKAGWSGVRSADGLVAYLNHPGSDNIFAVSYNPGAEGVLNYKNIFDMIVNSLELN